MIRSRKTESFDLKGAHHNYRVDISIPESTPPSEGFPVLYVLDGDAYFTMIDQIVNLQSRRADKTGVSELIIVGIGYEGNDVFSSFRVYDYTPPAQTVDLPEKPDGQPWPDHGGAKDFQAFIEKKLMPVIHKDYPVNKQKQAIFGHSLGGLFALYTLFTRQDLFQNYLAFSPSIWWNNRAVLNEEKHLRTRNDKRLYIAIEHTSQKNMYHDAQSLYTRLAEGDMLADIDFRGLNDESHMSIVPTALSDALRFLCRSF
ncbi:alpha/beta hydrolase [Aquibacillus rhizosphaerae]|uniref:Alpha/beta hydrolase-fold protein n=1 Tax=Aquibacillus rhizosphaerae TaxID=3051431 RepID=A0ABT7L913_9BACI|nr:alpha/beta hydrolase-fold protein [Aquibacillus sp. LR5S19]MDL4842366.1 alpha/beta hydrolase-fold protein [Aquibacillus sp. LR5S19]